MASNRCQNWEILTRREDSPILTVCTLKLFCSNAASCDDRPLLTRASCLHDRVAILFCPKRIEKEFPWKGIDTFVVNIKSIARNRLFSSTRVNLILLQIWHRTNDIIFLKKIEEIRKRRRYSHLLHIQKHGDLSMKRCRTGCNKSRLNFYVCFTLRSLI